MQHQTTALPVALDLPELTVHQVDWGGMTVEYGVARAEVDPSPFFAGLPDDRCQCPHWGYILKGRLRYRYADHEEVYGPGEVYYAPPGHTPIMEAGAEWVEFSPSDQLAATMVVVERNFATQTPG